MIAGRVQLKFQLLQWSVQRLSRLLIPQTMGVIPQKVPLSARKNLA